MRGFLFNDIFINKNTIMAKIIKLKESDLENIVKRVLAEQGEVEMDMDMEVGDEEEGDAIEITLDHIAMLLKDGECSCSGQKLVLDLEGGHEEEDDDDED
jgi:hypothetical protein